jgi:hypothetical protein
VIQLVTGDKTATVICSPGDVAKGGTLQHYLRGVWIFDDQNTPVRTFTYVFHTFPLVLPKYMQQQQIYNQNELVK